MNLESVKSLFSLFADTEDIDKYLPILSLAISQTKSMLYPDADIEDDRLNFLSAAIANYRYQQILSANSNNISAYNGEMITKPSDSGSLKYAEKLMLDYMELCNDLISSRSFAFLSF